MLTKEQFRERLLRDANRHKRVKAKELDNLINGYVIDTVVKCKRKAR